MDFKIEKSLLQKGLSLAAGIADRKNTLPILANVLIRTDGKKKIICAATDLHVTLIAELPAKVDKEGGLTLAAKQFGDIVRGLASDEVHISRTEQNWAEIRNGRSEFKVVGMADREYPKLPASGEVKTVEIKPSILCEMIGKTAYSVSNDETRQHLAGVLFECDGTRARMVSTDGHRLSKVERDFQGPVLEKGILIPRKGIMEIRRLLEGREKPCEFGVDGSNLVVRADELTLTVKLSDSQFPPYQQVIPKEYERKVFVPRDALLDALKRVSIMASDKTFGVRLSVEKGWLGIEADSPDMGNARERIEIGYQGTPVTVGFNARYFIDFLGELDGPEVQIEVAGELDPVVLRSSDSGDYLGVVMPMRL
jgi:DNA polymerase III subunit beta